MKSLNIATLKIEDEYHCYTYYGFGNGIAISKTMTNKSLVANENKKEVIQIDLRNKGCSNCLLNEECWKAHRKRVNKMFPELAILINQVIQEGFTGVGFMKEMNKRITGGVYVDPYISVMTGNIQDAGYICVGMEPADRGKHTLSYPFVNE